MRRTIALPALLALATGTAGAQTPLSTGSATGHGVGATTEARGAEAVLWNPGLLGIYDGPMGSWVVPGIVVEPATLANLQRGMSELNGIRDGAPFTVGSGLGSALRAYGADRTGGGMAPLSGVQWVGLHTRGLGLSVQSTAQGWGSLPTRATRILDGEPGAARGPIDEVDMAESGRRLHYGIASTAAVGAAGNFGAENRRLWTGVTGHASWIHASGATMMTLDDAESMNAGIGGPANPAYGDQGVRLADVRLSNVIAYGVDVGMAATVTPSILVGLTGVNLWQKTTRRSDDEGGFTARRLDVPGLDASGRPVGVGAVETFSLGTAPDDLLATATEVARATRFTPAVRGSMAIETSGGRLLAGGTIPLDSDPAIDRETLDRWTVGFEARAPFAPRLSYGHRLSGEQAISLGIEHETCSRRAAAGVMYLAPAEGGRGRFAVTASFGGGQGPCRGLQRERASR